MRNKEIVGIDVNLNVMSIMLIVMTLGVMLMLLVPVEVTIQGFASADITNQTMMDGSNGVGSITLSGDITVKCPAYMVLFFNEEVKK